MYDYNKLKGKIIEVFGTQREFAKAMKLSERTMTLKLNNKIDWKQSEIVEACRLLGIKEEEVMEYFFALEVQYNWTKNAS